MDILRTVLTALVLAGLMLCKPTQATEWDGFGDALIGTDISTLDGFRKIAEDLFVRDSDKEMMAAVGLHEVIYQIAGVKIVALQMKTNTAQEKQKFLSRIEAAWGKPDFQDQNEATWIGPKNRLLAKFTENGAIFILGRKPLTRAIDKAEPDEWEATSTDQLLDWADRLADEEAEKARQRAEIAAIKAKARAEAEAVKQATLEALEEERAKRCGTAGGWQIVTPVYAPAGCKDSLGQPIPCPPLPPFCMDAEGHQVPMSCC